VKRSIVFTSVPAVHILRPTDPRLAEYRDVREPALLRDRGQFVAEGRLVVERLIDDGRCMIHSLLVSPSAYEMLEPKLRAIPAATPVYVGEPADLRLIMGFDFHRGCLAIAERPEPIATCEILRDAVTLVILEGVTDADNVGGVFRNAAAFGADGVLLSPTCCDPLYRKAIRTSMAATLRVPFARIDSWPDGLADVRACGFTLVALTPREPSQTLDSFVHVDRPPRVALLVGTEGAGLSESVELLADRRVRVPISHVVDSLNLAVATGIVLSRLSAEPAL
jgi:tRNA G18 (ribose-2'-O)-methylase SpoU